MDKKIIQDKSALFALTEPMLHYVKVAPEQEEYLKVWVKEPTWIEVDRAMNNMMKIDAKNQDIELDINAMFKFMVEHFIVKTEPSLSAIEVLRLTPYIGNQLKEILPNPFTAFEEDSEKND